MSTSAISILTVEGKTITHTAALPVQANGAAVHIKAVKGGKYLLVSANNQPAPDHIVVKRVGKDLQIFTQDGDTTPEVVIDGFYDAQGELAGMSSDGTWHTYVDSSSTQRDAFLMLDEGASDTLVMSSTSTTGLSGLTAASSAISGGTIALGALGALAALGVGIAAAGGGGGGGSDKGNGNASSSGEPVAAPQPQVPHDNQAIDDRNGNNSPIAAGSKTNDNQPLLSGIATPGSTVRVYDNGQLIGSAQVGNDGQWQFKPLSPLSDARHELSFSEVNADGVESAQSAPIAFDIDTTPPAAPTEFIVTDGNGQDLTHGGISDANPVNFAGKGEPGDTVIIYDGDKAIGSAIVGEDGSWSAEITLPGEGDHAISIGFTDPAGNQSATTAPIPVSYDITPPAVPVDVALSDANGKDLSAGGATNTNPLQLGGTGEPGDTALIYDGDTLIGSAIVGDDGRWSAEITLPGEGEHAISVGMKDPAGNESDKSTPVVVDFDTTPPAVPTPGELVDGKGSDLSAGGDTNDSSVKMSGTGGTPGDTVNLYDGDKLIGSVVVGDDGSWEIPAELAGDGEHSLSTSYTDPAGNESQKSTPVVVDLDTTPPEVPAPGELVDGKGTDLSAGGLTNDGSMNMSGTGGTPGDTVNLYDGNTLIGSVEVGNDGSWTIPVTLIGDGEHSLSTSYSDPLGNESEKSAAVVVDLDTTPPAVPAPGELIDGKGSDLSAGGLTNDGSMNMSGTGGTPGDTVNLYDGDTLIGSVEVGSDGSWTIPVELIGDGEHSLSTSYSDPAGNESLKSTPVVVDLDTTAPDTPVVSALTDGKGSNLIANDLTNNGSITLSGSGGEPGDTVKLYDGNTLIGTIVVGDDGSWSIPATLSGDGVHELSASYTDPAGNEGDKSPLFPVDLDTTPPEAPVINAIHDGAGKDLSEGGATRNKSITLTGSGGIEGDTVKIYNGENGNVLGTAVVKADGSWSVTIALSTDGLRDFQATYTDPAGNESAHSAGIPVTLDTVAAALAAPTVTDSSGKVLAYGEATNELKPLLTGSGAEPFAKITLRIALGASQGWGAGNVIYYTTADENGNWSIQVTSNLPDGDMFFKAQQTDVLGNTSVLGGQSKMHINTGSNAAAGTFSVDSVHDDAAHGSLLNVDEKQHQVQDAEHNGVQHAQPVDAAAAPQAHDEPAPAAEADAANASEAETAVNLIDEQPISLANLSQLVQETSVVSLEGNGDNTLNLNINDVLSVAKEDLFIQDGNKQLMVNGDQGDSVNLESIAGENGVESWNAQGEVDVNGTVYNVYQSDSHEVEVLIQQGIQTQLH